MQDGSKGQADDATTLLLEHEAMTQPDNKPLEKLQYREPRFNYGGEPFECPFCHYLFYEGSHPAILPAEIEKHYWWHKLEDAGREALSNPTSPGRKDVPDATPTPGEDE